MPSRAIDMKKVTETTPLRLSRAVEIAWPAGGMTVSGLRREAARGKLVIERMAGKDFVTLAAIERMRELCRVERKGQGSGSGPKSATPAREPSERTPSGSSGTALSCLDGARGSRAVFGGALVVGAVMSSAFSRELKFAGPDVVR